MNKQVLLLLMRKAFLAAVVVFAGLIVLPILARTVLLTGIDFSMSINVLYAIAGVIVIFDIGGLLAPVKWKPVTESLRTIGMWALSGLFLNTLTVAVGLLALMWDGVDSLPLLQSMLQPVFEFAGVVGPVFFIGFVIIGLVKGTRGLVAWIDRMVFDDADGFFRGADYKKLLMVGVLAFGMAVIAGRRSLVGDDVVNALSYLVIPVGAVGVLHITGALVKIFGRDPWKEAAAELMRGVGLAVLAYVALTGISAPVDVITARGWGSDVAETLAVYSRMVSGLGIWVAAYIGSSTLLQAFSMYVTREDLPWFYERLGDEPGILGRFLAGGAVMMALVFVLFDSSGLLATSSKVNLGSLALPAYGMICAVILSRYIELLWLNGKGVALAGFVEWVGIGQFVAILLTNLPSVIETLGYFPVIGGLASGMLPIANAVSDAAWWFVAAFAIAGLTRVAGRLEVMQSRAGLATLVSAISFVAFGWVGWAVADAFATFGPGYSLLGAILLGTTAGASLSLLARYVSEYPNLLVATLARWLSESRFRAMNMGGFLAAYLLMLRPTVVDAFVYAGLLEWVIVALLALYISRRTWSVSQDLSAPEALALAPENWTHHRQKIDEVPEAEINQVFQLQDMFIDDGEVATLAMRCSVALWDHGASIEEIAVAIDPLLSTDTTAEHGFMRVLTSVLPGSAARREEIEQERRRRVLSELSVLIEEMAASISRSRRSRAASIDIDEVIQEPAAQFIQDTNLAGLFAASIALMWSSGAKRSFVSNIVGPLAAYRDADLPWYAVGPLRKRNLRASREKRSLYMSGLHHALATWSSN